MDAIAIRQFNYKYIIFSTSLFRWKEVESMASDAQHRIASLIESKKLDLESLFVTQIIIPMSCDLWSLVMQSSHPKYWWKKCCICSAHQQFKTTRTSISIFEQTIQIQNVNHSSVALLCNFSIRITHENAAACHCHARRTYRLFRIVYILNLQFTQKPITTTTSIPSPQLTSIPHTAFMLANVELAGECGDADDC